MRRSTTFQAPLKWRKPRTIFTCSMSDFFHEDADGWRDDAWEVIRRTPRHTYQILTKRPERIPACLPNDWDGGWPNVWLGVSVEMQEYLWRAELLTGVPAQRRFLSCEPLLGPLHFVGAHVATLGIFIFQRMDWVITGGESGPNPRLSNPDWFRDIRDQCKEVGIAYFHKQNGGKTKCKCHGAWGCRLLDGRTCDEMPQILLETR